MCDVEITFITSESNMNRDKTLLQSSLLQHITQLLQGVPVHCFQSLFHNFLWHGVVRVVKTAAQTNEPLLPYDRRLSTILVVLINTLRNEELSINIKRLTSGESSTSNIYDCFEASFVAGEGPIGSKCIFSSNCRPGTPSCFHYTDSYWIAAIIPT